MTAAANPARLMAPWGCVQMALLNAAAALSRVSQKYCRLMRNVIISTTIVMVSSITVQACVPMTQAAPFVFKGNVLAIVLRANLNVLRGFNVMLKQASVLTHFVLAKIALKAKFAEPAIVLRLVTTLSAPTGKSVYSVNVSTVALGSRATTGIRVLTASVALAANVQAALMVNHACFLPEARLGAYALTTPARRCPNHVQTGRYV